MNFRIDRWHATLLRSSLLAVTVAGTLLLASCGGGNGNENQSTKFEAQRLFVFGDESNLLLPPSSPTAIDAKKYTVNGFTPGTTPADTVPDCRVDLLWVQYVAAKYGLVFAECNPSGATVTAQMRATVGAKVADVVAALNTFFAGDSFGKRDLVTIMVGANDILELYDRVTNSANPAPLSEAAALAAAESRGRLLADQYDRITNDNNTGGRALYVPIPDLGESPFGIGNAERVRLLKALSGAFNDELRVAITNNGRSIGLLNAYQRFHNIIRAVLNDGDDPFGLINVTGAACTTALPDCTTLTLQPANGSIPAATAFAWLWADGTHLSPGGQRVLGEDALDLLDNLPF